MKDKTLRCDCIGGTHYISFITVEDEGTKELYIDLITDLHHYSFWNRLKKAILVLRGKECCLDGIILHEKSKLIELLEYLKQ